VNQVKFFGIDCNDVETINRLINHFEKSQRIYEAFLVPGHEIRSYEEAAVIAIRIKDEIKRQERIICSVGVGPNKLTAKIASKFKKPEGLTIVRPEDVGDFSFP